MKEQTLTGLAITLPSGASVAMARHEEGYAIQFRNTFPDIKTAAELAADPTSCFQLIDGEVVTSVFLTECALAALCILFTKLRQREPRQKNDEAETKAPEGAGDTL